MNNIEDCRLQLPERSRPQLTGLRYLNIARNQFDRRLLTGLLTSFGIKFVRESQDVTGAMWRIQKQRPDVILFSDSRDCDLVDLNRVCDASPSQGKPRISIIAIASAPSAEYVELALAIGVSSVVAKPFSISTLMSHVGRAVNRNANMIMVD